MRVDNDLVIRHSTLIHARVECVYDCFTTVEGLDSWFTSGAQVDLRPGGMIRLRWLDWGPEQLSTEDVGRVLEAVRPKRFVFQWQPDNPSYYTTVEVDFESKNEDTIVSVLEYGYQDTTSGRTACLNCAAGWGEALTLLKFYAEHGLHY